MVSSLKERLEFHVEFKERYFKILNDFGFSYQKDKEARDLLEEIIRQKSRAWNLEDILGSFMRDFSERRTILIHGCGPSLEATIEFLLKERGLSFFSKCINIAADGAAVLLKEKGIPIFAIFTDLDGITREEFESSRYIVVHSHGDNIDKLRFFRQEILNKHDLIGTTQVESSMNVINPGGFTDGDRILFFLRSLLLPRHRLYLIGMDFQDIIGKYSKPNFHGNVKGTLIKQKKLRYALELITWISERMGNRVVFLNSTSEFKNFKNLSLQDFKKVQV